MTDIFIGSRCSGKTTKLIKMSAAGEGAIVTLNRHQCSYIVQTATEMGLVIPQPITFAEFLQTVDRHPERKWLIDELGHCLESLNVTAATLSLESAQAMNGVQITYR